MLGNEVRVKKSIVLSMVIVLVLVAVGCDSSGGSSSLGTLVYNGQSFNLDGGELELWGANGTGPESYDIDVMLGDSDGVYGIYLDLNSDQLAVLSVGTYAWSSSRAVFTLVEAVTFSGVLDSAVSGTVTVTQSGSQYSLQWNLTMASGAAVSGSFTGPLPII